MKITPVIEELILKHHADGLNCCQIALKVGCSHMTANKVVRQAGLRADYKINKEWGKEITSGTLEPIRQYYDGKYLVTVYPPRWALNYRTMR